MGLACLDQHQCILPCDDTNQRDGEETQLVWLALLAKFNKLIDFFGVLLFCSHKSLFCHCSYFPYFLKPCLHSVCEIFSLRRSWAAYRNPDLHILILVYRYQLGRSEFVSNINCSCSTPADVSQSVIHFSSPASPALCHSPFNNISSLPSIVSRSCSVVHPSPTPPALSRLLPSHLVPIFLYWHRSRFLNVFLNVALHSA